MAVSPSRAGRGGAATAVIGDAGLDRDEATSFALALPLKQLISAGCWQREHTQRGVGLWEDSAAPPQKYLTSGTFHFLSSGKNICFITNF